MREIAWVRDLYRCVICGERVDDGHHRVAKGMGGRSNDEDRHRPDRVLSCCTRHHIPFIHRFPALSAALGYIVLAGEIAETKPVWYQKEQCWFTLTQGGTRLYCQIPPPKEVLDPSVRDSGKVLLPWHFR